jgi:hypothetical protein
MNPIFAALAAVLLLSSAASAEVSSNTDNGSTHVKSVHRVSGSASRYAPVVRPPKTFAGSEIFSSQNFASSNLPSYGGPLSLGPGQRSTVAPLRPMPRSRTSGSGVFVAGPVQGRGYTAEQAAPASVSVGGGSKIRIDGNGRSLGGVGVASGKPDTLPSGGNGSDPLSNILKGIAGIFGDMAKMLGGG